MRNFVLLRLKLRWKFFFHLIFRKDYELNSTLSEKKTSKREKQILPNTLRAGKMNLFLFVVLCEISVEQLALL